MKKLVVLFAVVAAMCASAAWADPPQGQLTGAAFPFLSTIGIDGVAVVSPILDGETVYVAKRNDYSGDCNDDTGSVDVRYSDGTPNAVIPISCAHFTGAGKIVVSWFDAHVGAYVLFRVIDKPLLDAVEYASSADEATVRSWVNVGTRGNPVLTQVEASDGDYSVTP